MSQEETNLTPVSQTQVKRNPLSGYFRQPKIYVKLPSNGEFYPEGTLDVSTNGEYAVYAMTAKDELMFKTPDALLSGESTVSIIKSCVPAISNPWVMPSIDLDFILVAIRVASYGNKMEVTTNCPSCKEEQTYDIDLSNWIGSLGRFQYEKFINVNPLTVEVRPYTYQQITKTSLKAMEQQRMFQLINDDQMSDEEKVEKFGKSFVKLTELTVDIISDCIVSIETPEGKTSDKSQIKEFIDNCSREIFDKIQEHLTGIKSQIEFKSNEVKCGACNHQFSMPITMDQSNFFAVRS
jgi:hypothetical protein